MKYQTAGKDANQAETLRRRIEHQESAKAEAVKAGVQIEPAQTRKTLAGTAAEYNHDAEPRHADETALQARNVTEEFIRTVRKTYPDELTRNDVLRFHAALRKRGCGDRTVANKHDRLKSWFLFAGVDRTVLPPRPRYELKLPTKYTSDEHCSILGAARPYMHVAIGLALKCGLRDQEIIFLEWVDIDEDAKVVQIRGKVKSGVADEERPAQSQTATRTQAVGQINRAQLRTECREWTLHKFRRTYATQLQLRAHLARRRPQIPHG